MNTLDLLGKLLADAGMQDLTSVEAEAFSSYLALLLKWNAKLNLTAIRDTEGILRRHFFECIFCARTLPAGIGTLLDFGSGGGFPGVPISICRPEIRVTLGESQNKKAAFLREVIRTLALQASVEQGRAEALRIAFDAVSLRAVDKMDQVISSAEEKVALNGYLVLMASLRDADRFQRLASKTEWQSPVFIPGSTENCVLLGRKTR